MGSLTGPPCGPLGYLRALSAAAPDVLAHGSRRSRAILEDGSQRLTHGTWRADHGTVQLA